MDDLQILHFDSVGGQHEEVSPTLLADSFSSNESVNIMIDKAGRIKSRDWHYPQDFVRLSSPLMRTMGLFVHRTTTAVGVTRHLLGIFDDGNNEWELHKSNDLWMTHSLVEDFGINHSGRIPDFAQFGNTTFLTNGLLAPRAWDGTSLSVAGATRSPTPMATVTDAGNLSGIYQWKIVSIEGDGTRGAGSVATEEHSLENQQASLVWTADANPEVVGYEVYRTLGTNKLYLLVDYTEETSYLDNLSDGDLLAKRALEEHGDPPPEGAYFMAAHKGRMWWFRTDAEPTTGWFSDSGDPDSVFLATNYLKFEDFDTQGDVLIGAVGNFGEQLVVFTERNLWTVSGTGILITPFLRDLNKEKKNAHTGAASKAGIVQVPLGALFRDQAGELVSVKERALAYMTPLLDIRLFDGKTDQIISHPVGDTLARVAYESRRRIHAVHDAKHGHLVWFVPLDGAGYPTHAIIWNYHFGAWYVWDVQYFSASTVTDSEAESSMVLVGNSDINASENVYEFAPRNKPKIGATVNSTWVSQPLYGVVSIRNDLQPAQSYTKRFRWVDLLIETTNPTTTGPAVSWFKGNAAAGYPPYGTKTITRSLEQGDFDILQSSDGQEILTSDGEQILVYRPRYQRKVRLIDSTGVPLFDVGVKLKVSMSGLQGTWSLEAFSLAYQILKGTKRRHG